MNSPNHICSIECFFNIDRFQYDSQNHKKLVEAKVCLKILMQVPIKNSTDF